MAYTVLSVVLGLLFAVVGGVLLRGRPLDPGLAARLPRARLPGAAIGIVCLVWSAYHGCLMLEGPVAPYRKLVWALVPVCGVLCYRFLDFLLARALGGVLVLSAATLLHGGFAEAIPFRPVYSTACYAVGILGMALVAVPWRFRDLLHALGRVTDRRRPDGQDQNGQSGAEKDLVERPGVAWMRPVGGLVAALGIVLAALPFLSRSP